MSSDLRQKILDILAQDDHDQDLDKLRTELVLRKQRVRRKIKQQMERHIEQSDRTYIAHMGAPSTSVVATQATSPPRISSASNVVAAVPRRSAAEEEARRERRRLRRAARRRGAEQHQQQQQQQQQQQEEESTANDARENSRRSSSAATTNQSSLGGGGGGGGGGGDSGMSSALATMFGQQGAGAHIAVDHADTSDGAVHCFQDELGNWHTYRFGSDSTGLATQVNTPTVPSANGNRLLSTLLQSADAPAQNSGGKVHESRYSNRVSQYLPRIRQIGGPIRLLFRNSEGFSAAFSAAFLACNFDNPSENPSQHETRQSNRVSHRPPKFPTLKADEHS